MYLPHTYRSLNGREGKSDGLPIDYDQNKMEMELYDLENDISETKNVAEQHPEIMQALLKHAEQARQDLGDSLTDRKGNGTRPIGTI